jgi:hypothetical protein
MCLLCVSHHCLQVLPLLPLASSDMVERLTSGSSPSDDEGSAATASLDWHAELASINQSHADSPSEFYTYVKGSLSNEDSKRSRLIEPVAQVSGSHPSVSGTVSMLHLTTTSFSKSSSSRVSSFQHAAGRGIGGGGGVRRPPSQFQPLLTALSASLSCLE